MLSACRGPALTIINESSAWLRFEAAAEVDPQRGFISGPLAGDPSTSFGVPPGARYGQRLEPGGSVLARYRLGVQLRVRAGPNPNSSDSRDPLRTQAYTVNLPPPGPYVLRFVGQPGSIEIFRVDAAGTPMPEARSRILPEASLLW